MRNTPALTLNEFLQSAPLYTKKQVELPDLRKDLVVSDLLVSCAECGGERPFRDDRPRGSGARLHGVRPPKEPLDSGIYGLFACCGFCRNQHYRFWIEVNREEGWVRKVGQLPQWRIEIDKDVAGVLGSDAELYRRGLLCLSQGYGLGACGYFRRLLDNRVDGILERLENLLRLNSNQDEEANRIANIRGGKAAVEKLREAYPLVPPSILVDGLNPLKVLYEKFSIGLHNLSEDECCNVAQDTQESLVYIATELNRALTTRERFSERIKKLSRKPTH